MKDILGSRDAAPSYVKPRPFRQPQAAARSTMCHLRDALPACVKPMNLAMIDSIETRRQEGALHRFPGAPSLVALLRGHWRPVGAMLLAVGAACAVCPIATWAQASVADSAPRINVWGVAVDAYERSAVTIAEARDAAAAPSQPHLVRSVALQQSQWGDPAATPAQAALAGAARPDMPAPAGAAVQATDVSYRWGLGTVRSAVDVGLGAGAYRVRYGADAAALATPSAASSLPSGPGAESRRDAVVPTVSVGLRHSLSDQQRLSVYAGGSASLSSASVGEFYTTKVKVEWLPTRNSSFGFEHAAVNMRFGSNGNFALRVRRGGPMIYYRSTF